MLIEYVIFENRSAGFFKIKLVVSVFPELFADMLELYLECAPLVCSRIFPVGFLVPRKARPHLSKCFAARRPPLFPPSPGMFIFHPVVIACVVYDGDYVSECWNAIELTPKLLAATYDPDLSFVVKLEALVLAVRLYMCCH